MKLIIVAAALVALAVAAPQNRPDAKEVKILRSEYDQQPNGAYKINVETDDGTKKSEDGEVKSVPDEDNKPHDVVVVRGSYAWVDQEGQTHNVNYYADETGFHAESADIPVGPVARR